VVCLWIAYRFTRKPHIVDVGWGFGIALVTAYYAIVGSGDILPRVLLAVMLGVWGLRLAGHLFISRILHDHRDGRYDALEAGWKKNIPFRYMIFYQFQAMFIVILTAPFLASMLDPTTGMVPVRIAGVAIWMIAIIGETVADRQLRVFKSDPANAGKVCSVGLWNSSRHPNYFFEWLVWVGVFVFVLPSPFGWTAILGPVVMLWLLTRVTGIPMTEEQAVRSKGDAYREYQRTTSAFIPWRKQR
jgi:steroid 5-alpha reductase family enzyme